jgi:hypothetical protein
MIVLKMVDAACCAMAILFLAYLIESARERGVLMHSLGVVFLILVAAGLLIGVPVTAH